MKARQRATQPASSGRANARASGRYQAQSKLASGGMGVVWRALDRSDRQELALKRVQTNGPHAALTLEAFRREYQVLKGIRHPRIIRVFDYGIDEQGPYYTMELLGGQDLRALAPVNWRVACVYLRDVATSLALLHARKYLHRDVSPSNVRVTPDGHCKLLDFGALSPFGRSRMVVGTAPMVPPEVLRDEALDQRADLYSLGALAYFIISGRHAYPAKSIDDLPRRLLNVPPRLSALNPEIPAELDELVMSLLHEDPRARPVSAAQVIAHLNSIADLPPEKLEDASDLLHSFLTSPRFVGRHEELALIDHSIEALLAGRGSAIRFEGLSGMGRSRLLEEAALRAQLAGAAAIRADASLHGRGSAVESLALRLFDTLPDIARREARRSHAALRALSPEVAARLASDVFQTRPEQPPADGQGSGTIEDWIGAVANQVPLVLLVDNLEQADAGSVALLAALARRTQSSRLLLLLVERSDESHPGPGLSTLRGKCQTRKLEGLSANEVLELARSLFGEGAENVERFAGWLHDQTAGSPLYFLELVRQLVARDLIRHVAGLWVLPHERPGAALPERLETALIQRMQTLGPGARALCGRLALHRLELSHTLCEHLLPDRGPSELSGVLSELAQRDILTRGERGYSFTSSALRDALVKAVPEYEKLDNHRQLGMALLSVAKVSDHGLRLEAGYHLIQGGRESEGADIIMRETCDSVVLRRMVANLFQVGRTVAAALEVYTRQRRSAYERAPLLGALAHAGFYENPAWGDRYGDQALDVLENISGLTTARRARRFCGRFLGLMVGLLSAYARYRLTPRRERPYSFREVLTQLLSAATTLTAIAATTLDAERAARVADVIEPFSALPDRATPTGIYQFCRGLQQIARERPAEATRTFETLLSRFRSRGYYPTLPRDARELYVAGLWFAIGAFAVFRSQGEKALEAAAQLDASGLKMYSMVASQLRYLYYANRAEIGLSAVHREQVELYAAYLGSAGQVERWESPALLPLHIYLGDVVGITRAIHRMELDSGAPYMRPYRRLAELSMLLTTDLDDLLQVKAFLMRDLTERAPRSFIGWAMVNSALARVYLHHGEAAEAERWCRSALGHVTEDDLRFVILFLDLHLQLAAALSAQGKHAEALAHLDHLLARYAPDAHPLSMGLLHEARARAAFAAGRREDYLHSTREAERFWRPTNTPLLIAKCEKLWQLGRASTGNSIRPDPSDPESAEVTSVSHFDAETTLQDARSEHPSIPPL